MRTDSAAFAQKNIELAKDPRYVIELAFDSANTVLWYFTSHSDAALPPAGVSGSILAVVQGLSGTSQTLNPDTANASIGNIDFSLVDRLSVVTATLGGQLVLGRGTRKQRVRVYVGYQGLAWADYTLVQTQLVTEIAFSDGAYKFRCQDIQREMRKDLFVLAKTNLSASVLAADTTINVVSTTGFTVVTHGTSYSDAPSVTVGYFRIEDEIVRYTGGTATSFTGCVRGALNTRAVDHLVDVSAATDRRPVVSEYVYLELPAIDLMYRLLTGKDRLGASVMPATWNLAVSTSYVRLSDFTGIGADLWDTTDDQQGFVVRLEDLEKIDGKKFIEMELALLCGVFMPIYADGALGCKRMANILAGAAHTGMLDERNIVSHGDLVHDFGSLHNVIQISWNWEPLQKDFTRVNVLVDAASIAIHGRSDPLKLKFRGLHGSRHSSTIIAQRFDSLRDRFTGPPLRLDVNSVPSQNTAEVGDVKRVRLANVRDFVAPGGGGTLDRSFEIQNVAVDWITGALKKKLFASSQAPGAMAATSDATVLSSAWYTGTGTALTSVLTITGSNPGHVTASGSLAGNVDMNAAGAIYYYDGDLQIDAAVEVAIANNVQLRVKGFLQNNGTINGKGRGLGGAVAKTALIGVGSDSPVSDQNLGVAGFIGITEAGGGLLSHSFSLTVSSVRSALVQGKNATTPIFNLSWDGTTLRGTPADLRGSSGSSGMSTIIGSIGLLGGAGGNGGAGLCIISRGFAQGVAGKIDLSGNDGLSGQASVGPGQFAAYAGSGAGGAPGGLAVFLDGAGVTATGLTDAGFVALYGRTPVPPRPAPASDFVWDFITPLSSFFVGTGDGTTFPLPNLSNSRGGSRVQYVPANPAANRDPPVDETIFGQLQDAFLLNNWVRQSSPSVQTLGATFYDATAPFPYVCAGQPARNTAGNILVSHDASLWELMTNPTAQPIFGFAWNGTCYVAVGNAPNSGNGLLLRSTDGASWTQQTPAAAEVFLSGIAWVPWLGLFIAVGGGTWTGGTFVGSPRIWTSPTGVTWTARTAAVRGVCIAFNSNVVIVGGSNDSSPTDARIQYSTDGINWTTATIDNANGYGINGLAYGNGRWVGVGGENDVIVSADNGLTWTKGAALPLFNNSVGIARKVAFSGQVFGAVGVAETGTSRGAVVVARSAQDWQARNGIATSLFGIAWTGNFWLVTGAAESGTGYIATSLRR